MFTPIRILSLCSCFIFSALALQSATFPLPIPNRPTSFPMNPPAVEGSVVMWGDAGSLRDPFSGQITNRFSGITNAVAVDVIATGTVAILTSDGKLTVKDSSSSTYSFPSWLDGIVSISGGLSLLRGDGTVVGMRRSMLGDSISLVPVNVPAEVKDVVLIAGDYQGGAKFAIKVDGTVVAWDVTNESFRPPSGLKDVVAIEVSWSHAVALKGDGTLVAWGPSIEGTSLPVGLKNVVAVSPNGIMALKSDGSVIAWGSAKESLPADLSNVVAISDDRWGGLAIKADGTVVSWRIPFTNDEGGRLAQAAYQKAPVGLSGVFAIAGGGGHAVALKAVTKPVSTHPPSLSVRVSKVVIDLNLSTGVRYQLESSTDLRTWFSVETPFVAPSESLSKEFPVSDVGRFFRIVEVP